jgi:hypothetical protein
MNNAFDKKLRQAAFRFHANLLLERLGMLLLAAGMLAVAATLCHRLLAYPTLNYSMLAVAAAFAAALALAWWLVRRPGRMQLAIILDERLATKERFSTALALAAADDPFAQAANEEAHARAAGLDPRRHFPIRPSRRWAYAAAAWAAAAAVLAFVPDIDALGLLAQQKHEQQKSQDLARTAAEIRDQVSKVESTVKQLGDPQLTKDLDALKDMQNPNAQDAKRQAIQKLGDLNDRVKELEKKKELDQASALKEMLQQVKTPYTNDDARKISQAVAKGEYNKAAELLKESQKKIEDGKLSDKEKKDLASQLKEFGEQLDKLAKEDRQLQDELEKAGLDKGLADKSLDDLKKELKKQGLTDEQIQKIMDKASQCKSACNSASELADALKKCNSLPGGNVSGELADVAGQLSELEGKEQMLRLAEASVEDIKNAIVSLGEDPNGDSSGAKLLLPGPGSDDEQSGNSPWASQSEGHANAHRDTSPDAKTDTTKSRVENPAGSQGPIIASRYIKGAQVKGEAAKKLSDVVQAAKDSAAQAITDNQIPKKYEGPIKKYYGQFDETPTTGPAEHEPAVPVVLPLHQPEH